MKLIKEQIKYIDETLSLNGVVYQDVKLELIDHIASDIEEYSENNNSDFDEAFKAVFEKWKPELKPTVKTVLLLNDFKGPKIVADKMASYFKGELRKLLIFTLILYSILSVLLHLNFGDEILKWVNYFMRASFVFYILMTILGVLFIWISGIKTTYSRLFLRRSTQIFGLPLMFSLEILQYQGFLQSFSFWQGLVINLLIMFLLASCLYNVKPLFEHFKTVKKYKLI